MSTSIFRFFQTKVGGLLSIGMIGAILLAVLTLEARPAHAQTREAAAISMSTTSSSEIASKPAATAVNPQSCWIEWIDGWPYWVCDDSGSDGSNSSDDKPEPEPTATAAPEPTEVPAPIRWTGDYSPANGKRQKGDPEQVTSSNYGSTCLSQIMVPVSRDEGPANKPYNLIPGTCRAYDPNESNPGAA